MMDEDVKFQLQHRVYPAIKSCVNNRYLILTSIFAFFSFVLNSGEFKDENTIYHYGAMFFTAIILLNAFNYSANAKEQYRLEGKEYRTCGSRWKRNRIEIIFSSLTIIGLWVFTIYAINIK